MAVADRLQSQARASPRRVTAVVSLVGYALVFGTFGGVVPFPTISDETVILTPAVKMDLEQALEFIYDDELVAITPEAIRIRKRWLKENERRKAARASA